MPYRTLLSSKKYSLIRLQSFAMIMGLLMLMLCVLGFHYYYTPSVLKKMHLRGEEFHPFSTRQLKTFSSSFDLPVYYINLDTETERKEFIRQKLKQWGFKDINRVSAWTTNDVRRFVTSEITSVPNLLEKNDKEIACIASHLYAMLLAVEDDYNSSPYALIIEDDVSLEMDVNWKEMIENAPDDFSILQLTTSNSEAVTKMWKEYVEISQEDGNSQSSTFLLRGSSSAQVRDVRASSQWKLRKWDSALWSTQAYVIHKQHIKEKLSKFIKLNDEDHHYHIHLKNPDPKEFHCSQWMQMCVMPFRLVADIVLYTFLPPSYVSRIPVFNGASAKKTSTDSSLIEVGSADKSERVEFVETSTISNAARVKRHQEEFDRINTAITAIKGGFSHLLPSYFKVNKPILE